MLIDATMQFLDQKAAEHSSEIGAIWVALIAEASAIFGATIGSLVSFFTAKITASNQAKMENAKLKAMIISGERTRWSQDIRLKLSTVCTKMDMQYSLLQRPVIAPLLATRQQQLDDLSNETMTGANVIYLMLNPAKNKQRGLRDSLHKSQLFLLNHFDQPQIASPPNSQTAYAPNQAVDLRLLPQQ